MDCVGKSNLLIYSNITKAFLFHSHLSLSESFTMPMSKRTHLYFHFIPLFIASAIISASIPVFPSIVFISELYVYSKELFRLCCISAGSHLIRDLESFNTSDPFNISLFFIFTDFIFGQ